MMFFVVGDGADGDSEADGRRRKLPVIATLTLKGTSALGRVWRVLDCCGGSQRPRQSTRALELFFFGRGAA